jgi:hypothetical protein
MLGRFVTVSSIAVAIAGCTTAPVETVETGESPVIADIISMRAEYGGLHYIAECRGSKYGVPDWQELVRPEEFANNTVCSWPISPVGWIVSMNNNNLGGYLVTCENKNFLRWGEVRTPTELQMNAACLVPSQPVGSCNGNRCDIPATTFQMPAWTGGDVSWPEHSVTLPAFKMDEFEVSQSWYRGCVTAGACTPLITGGDCNPELPLAYGYAVNCVTWTQADAFCNWAGGRLPTMDEWYVASRHAEFIHPEFWPTNPDSYCDVARNRKSICIPGTFSEDKSPYGIRDMRGGLSEWTSTPFTSTSPPTARMLTSPGGSQEGGQLYHYASDPSAAYLDLGFRCVY